MQFSAFDVDSNKFVIIDVTVGFLYQIEINDE